jgi:hypothetical protein
MSHRSPAARLAAFLRLDYACGEPGQPGGPLVVQEYDSSVTVPPGCSATLDAHGSIIVEVGDACAMTPRACSSISSRA